MKRYKAATVAIKAGPEDELGEGEFIGYASVFGNVDSYGDIVEPGAFAKTLSEWEDDQLAIPVLWGHDFSDPFSNIGSVVSAKEDDKGLRVHCKLDLDNHKAAQVYRLLKSNRVGKMSFAYDVIEGEKRDDGYHLRELKLYEVSIVPIGANDETEIVAVKAALGLAAKQGVLTQEQLDLLQRAHDALGAVIEALGTDEAEDDDEENDQDEQGKTEEVEDSVSKSAALRIITKQLELERV